MKQSTAVIVDGVRALVGINKGWLSLVPPLTGIIVTCFYEKSNDFNG